MRKFKCCFERTTISTLWVEVEANDREEAEELAYDMTFDADGTEWKSSDYSGDEELVETLELNEDGEWESDPCNIEALTKRINNLEK